MGGRFVPTRLLSTCLGARRRQMSYDRRRLTYCRRRQDLPPLEAAAALLLSPLGPILFQFRESGVQGHAAKEARKQHLWQYGQRKKTRFIFQLYDM